MKIYWKDPVGKDLIAGYEIWRAPAGLDPYFEGDKIADVGQNRNHYDDQELVVGSSYSYGIVVQMVDDAPLELPVMTITLPDSYGPFSDKLMAGDTTFGVYEYLSPRFRIFQALREDLVKRGVVDATKLSLQTVGIGTVARKQTVKLSLGGRVYFTTVGITAAFTGTAADLVAFNNALKDHIFEFDGYKYRVSLPTREQMLKVSCTSYKNAIIGDVVPKPSFFISNGASNFPGTGNTTSRCTVATVDPKTPSLVTTVGFDVAYRVSYVSNTAYYNVDTTKSYIWSSATVSGTTAISAAISLFLEPVGQGE